MNDTVKFTLGQTIYFKVKPEHVGMVTGILYRHTGVIYLVTWGHDMAERYHYECELTSEKSFVGCDGP